VFDGKHATCVDRRHDQWRVGLLPANVSIHFFKKVANDKSRSTGHRRFQRVDKDGVDWLKDEHHVFVGIKLTEQLPMIIEEENRGMDEWQSSAVCLIPDMQYVSVGGHRSNVQLHMRYV